MQSWRLFVRSGLGRLLQLNFGSRTPFTSAFVHGKPLVDERPIYFTIILCIESALNTFEPHSLLQVAFVLERFCQRGRCIRILKDAKARNDQQALLCNQLTLHPDAKSIKSLKTERLTRRISTSSGLQYRLFLRPSSVLYNRKRTGLNQRLCRS